MTRVGASDDVPELARIGAAALRALLDAHAVSAVEVVEAHLRRIEARDAEVRAWAFLDPELALHQARTRDERAGSGAALDGVPVGFKDICDTADMPTAYGSPIYAGARPGRDAACVAATRASGGIVLGKTVTTEFAGRNPDKTSNPLDPSRTPGGSSSGSAAAVADMQCPLAIGSQTAGSTIRPAAYCGVHALKPTFAAISFAGMKNLCARLDTIGLMGRSIDDLALFRCGLLGAPFAPLRPAEDPLRLGLCRTPYWDRASPAVKERVEAAAAALATAGFAVEEVPYPAATPDPGALCWAVIEFEMARTLAAEYAARAASMSPWARRSVENGRAIAIETHHANLRALAACEKAFDDLFGDFDALITPAAGEEAPVGLSDTGPPTFNTPFHVAGLPAVSVPLSVAPAAMPIGLQVIGQRCSDGRLLEVARAIELALE
jgi:amidase